MSEHRQTVPPSGNWQTGKPTPGNAWAAARIVHKSAPCLGFPVSLVSRACQVFWFPEGAELQIGFPASMPALQAAA
jgi:hypothetical protein